MLDATGLSKSERARPYQPYFEHIGLGVEIICLTQDECRDSSFFLRNAPTAIWIDKQPHSAAC